jgi:hypothetical protein
MHGVTTATPRLGPAHAKYQWLTRKSTVNANTDLAQQSRTKAQRDSSMCHINEWVGPNYTSQFCLFYETVLLIQELSH